MELNQVTLPVTDVPRAIAFYKRLGFQQIVDAPHYARFECRTDGPSLSVHRSDSPAGSDGVVIYFECEDLDAQVDRLRRAGVEIESGPIDQP